MKKITTLIAICCMAGHALSQSAKKYEANWDSLNTAPVPEWFNEAKIGLYIFWGPYSVPAYDPGDGYAEWYGMRAGKTDFHYQNYGKDFLYEDFADMWKAELWRPNEWADMFSESGAKYVIVVAKYHDGFCLIPTEVQSRTVNRNKWNSIDRGPKRDIIGELFKACEPKDLKMGLYISLYEWWHPLWVDQKKRHRYADEVFHPHFKEMVTNYKPWFVFTDGQWAAEEKIFKPESLLAWLLNDSPVKDYVVFNDRWGSESQYNNGMIFNTEFGGGEGFMDKAWQEDRSLGPSYGYNRNLKVSDYDTADELIRMILQVVSRGGNILLGVGPKADGTIPEIYQERLRQMGAWLKVNGEAIYGSTRWNKVEQSTPVNVLRTDPNIDFDWGLGTPDPALSKIRFDARWDGWIVPEKSGDHTFQLTTLGDAKLYLDDSLKLHRTGRNATKRDQADSVVVPLEKGKPYKFRLEYFRNQNSHSVKSAIAKLHWSYPGVKEQIVPASAFFVDQDATKTGLNASYSTNMADVYFTKKGNSLYAICPKWPGSELVLDSVTPSPGASISILGVDGNLDWEIKGGNLHIKVPPLTIDKLPCLHAWTFRIEDFHQP